MTCKQCVHHEKFHDDAFYCEAQNDLMEETDEPNAEECRWFVPLHVEGDEADASTAEVRSAPLADRKGNNE